MIAFLRGTLTSADEDSVTIDVQGVGYRAFVTKQTRSQLPEIGKELFLYTALEVREDSLTLYGFSTLDESETFRLLRNVSGIGPKTALNILSGMRPNELREAILFEDAARLARLPGIGKKTSQRLILELKDKMKLPDDFGAGLSSVSQSVESSVHGSAVLQAREALLELGYSAEEVAEVLKTFERQKGKMDFTVEEIVRRALKQLATM